MLPSLLLSVLVVALGTLAASAAMMKASNRSALWNMWVAGMVVLITAIVLVIAASVLVRSVFPELY